LQIGAIQAGVKIWARGHTSPAKVRFTEVAR